MQKEPKNSPIDEAMAFAKTPAGKQLISLLQNTNTININQAMDDASNGNYDKAKSALEPLLASPEVQALLRQMGGK